MIEIKGIPTYYTIGKKKPKTISLNMNWYRNSHFQVSNKIKHMVKEWIHDYLPYKAKIDVSERGLCFSYTIYRKTKRRADLGNLGAVIDKFVSDALVEEKVIPDDNTEFIREIRFIDGGVDKDNPRADLEIRRVK